MAVVMDRACHDFLADAALTGDENVAVRRRDLADQAEDLAHRLALTDDHLLEVVARLELLAQHLAFPGELTVLEEPADLAEDVFQDQRLQNVVVSSSPQCFNGRLDRGVRGYEQYESLRRNL